MSFSYLPAKEKPRERLLHLGPEALSLSELLAIILTTGTKEKSVLQVAQELIIHFGSLTNLLQASIEELKEIKGIGTTKAIQLKAAFGIALQMKNKQISPKIFISSQEAYELVQHEMSHQKQEILMVILKDVKGRLISLEKVAIGTLSDLLVHPREIFFPAVRHKAHSLILVHNHPSGDPTPSQADLELTEHLVKSGRIMGIPVEDHLIIGSHSFISLKEKGLLLQRIKPFEAVEKQFPF